MYMLSRAKNDRFPIYFKFKRLRLLELTFVSVSNCFNETFNVYIQLSFFPKVHQNVTGTSCDLPVMLTTLFTVVLMTLDTVR